MTALQHPIAHAHIGWENLQPWVTALLAKEFVLPGNPLPLDEALSEGLLPWLAYSIHDSGALDSLSKEQQEELRKVLRRWGLMHLDCEAELERLAASAEDAEIFFLAFKGHSVARVLYPHPACRPTSDFDLLISPEQVAQAQAWLAAAGYSPLQAFAGILWLGAQSWSRAIDGKARQGGIADLDHV